MNSPRFLIPKIPLVGAATLLAVGLWGTPVLADGGRAHHHRSYGSHGHGLPAHHGHSYFNFSRRGYSFRLGYYPRQHNYGYRHDYRYPSFYWGGYSRRYYRPYYDSYRGRAYRPYAYTIPGRQSASYARDENMPVMYTNKPSVTPGVQSSASAANIPHTPPPSVADRAVASPSPSKRMRASYSREPAAMEDYQSLDLGDKAWLWLAGGRVGQAQNEFARQAERNPRAGAPKAGYSLAVALSGNLDRAVWAMRRAFRIDPDSLRYLLIEKRLRPKLRRLVDEYGARVDSRDPAVDSAFMVAALRYIMHDDGGARVAIDRAIGDGDLSQSSANLRRLVAVSPQSDGTTHEY